MPTTRQLRAGAKVIKSPKSSKTKTPKVSGAAVGMVANVNSNHSPQLIKSIKRKKSSKTGVNYTKLVGNNSRLSDADNSNEMELELLNKSSNKVVFEEDGEMIDMETTDGGKAADEFKSDEDGEVSSEEFDDEKEDDEESQHDTSYYETEEDAADVSVSSQQEQDSASDSECECVRPPKRKRSSKTRRSVEDKLDDLSNSMKVMQALLQNQGIIPGKDALPARKGKNVQPKDSKGKRNNNNLTGDIEKEDSAQEEDEIDSDTTIYHNALDKTDVDIQQVDPEVSFRMKKQRESSSSKDQIDTSDELMEIDINEKFISDCAADAARQRHHDRDESTDGQNNVRGRHRDSTKQNRTMDMIRESEASKARMYATPGNAPLINSEFNAETNQVSPLVQHYSSMVDENYLVIGSYLDGCIQNKIFNSEYVDFSRLIPRDRISKDEDHRMELISRGGQTYFVPAIDRDHTNITSFSKWELAFRIFSNVYTRRFPSKAGELIQYNHIIYTASQTYVWDNVYTYDKEFRMHMSHYPQRSWGVILQQAWSMCLKDRLRHEEFNKNGNKHKKEACKRYNKGLCTAGRNCKYNHRCTVLSCGKYGHGTHICRKRNGVFNGSGDTTRTPEGNTVFNHDKK